MVVHLRQTIFSRREVASQHEVTKTMKILGWNPITIINAENFSEFQKICEWVRWSQLWVSNQLQQNEKTEM